MRPPLRAVICDLDGLLFDSEVLTRSAWQAAARALGHDLDDAYFATLIGRRIAVSEADVASRFALDVDAFRVAWRAEHHRLASAGGALPKPGRAGAARLAGGARHPARRRDLERAQRRAAHARPGRRPLPGGDHRRPGRARQARPRDLPRRRRRPGGPARGLRGVEDSEPGIAAAHAAGMAAIMVPDLKQPDAATRARAWRVCPTLVEARAELEALWSRGPAVRESGSP